MTYRMPTIDKLKAENAIYQNYSNVEEGHRILALLQKKDGTLRASKPKVKADDPVTGKAAYVWRMVAFMTSTNPRHQCMPCTADFDLPAINEETGKWGCRAARAMAEELKVVEDAIVNAIDISEWHGVHRWGRALYGA